MPMSLDEHVALITGAGRGLGRAIAQALAERGVKVAVTDIDLDGATQTVAACCAPGRAMAMSLDVASEAAVVGCVADVEAALGPITILVNNAGVCGTQDILELSPADWRRTLEINLTGAFLTTQAVARHMAARGGGGRIVNIGSLAGRSGGIMVSADYSASKAGLAGLTRAAARQLAAHRINVNCIAPGPMETDLTAAWGEEKLDALRRSIPWGRLGSVDDIAAAVVFLASPDADFITGAVLDVNGGLYMAP